MAYNDSINQKEITYLQEALQMENLCLAKYNVYADQCEDRELKSLLFTISKNKRKHADRIKDLLRQAGSTTYYQ